MNCHVCGGEMKPITTDLPFKLTEATTVIVKRVPTLQCESCREYLLEDHVMEAVDRLLSASDTRAEVEIVPYAA
ncbi:MAG: type II toxin-antitoxin system MqsA family antitoxin [Candidatus Hydrogenedentes bacterium]|nr:type II toxin-antitoxin system MqsA family antitoxin [Candidatus Hydrogenedentota bacterium]